MSAPEVSISKPEAKEQYVIVRDHEDTLFLTPDEATELANQLTDAVDQLDGRESGAP